jgi:2-aminoadipate transaminase
MTTAAHPDGRHGQLHQATDAIAFTRGVPPAGAIPSAELAAIAADLLAERAGALFQYAPLGGNRGDPALRAELARRHGADPDDVFVGPGSLQVLDLLAAHLLAGADQPADVIVEAPTYDRARQLFARHGARPVPVPVGAAGLDIDRLADRLAAGPRPGAVYTIPDFQNPGGVTLDRAGRQALLALAARHGVPVIEDSPYRELRYHGVAPPRLRDLAAASGARVITVSSLSKVLSPGVRVGYAVADPDTAAALARAAEGIYLSPAPLGQAVAATALAGGLVEANVARTISLLRPRHDQAVSAVADELGERAALLGVPGGGYYLGLRLALAAGLDERALGARAADLGLALTAGSAFHPPAAGPPGTVFVRLPFQGLEPPQLREGLRRLALAAAG